MEKHEELSVVEHKLIVQRIRIAVSRANKPLSLVRMEHKRERYDFENMTADQLSLWVVQWSQRGHLEVSWPATWWQHFKRSLYCRLPHWLSRELRSRWPVVMHTERHEAAHFLPAVPLPPNMREGEFKVWVK